MLTCSVPVSEAHGPCGEYGCDLTCNHGGCQEVARVCPVGFSMTETAVGIRCTGERPGSSGGGVGGNRVPFLSCQGGLQSDGRAEPGQALWFERGQGGIQTQGIHTSLLLFHKYVWSTSSGPGTELGAGRGCEGGETMTVPRDGTETVEVQGGPGSRVDRGRFPWESDV